MRKWLIATLAISMALHAAPVENGAAPSIIQRGIWISCNSSIDFRVGYEGDFIADGRMKQYDQGEGRVDTYEQWTNSGTLTLNIVDRWDIYGVFGSSKTKADWRFEDIEAGTITRIKLETEPHFLWAIGSRAVFYEWCNTSLGMGGRYTLCNSHPEWMTSNGVDQEVGGSQFRWRQWQVNLDLSHKIKFFIPYLGVKYSNAKTKLENFSVPISEDLTGSNRFKNRNSVGLYLGCALSNGKYFMLNLEARLIDEEAVTVFGEFRF